MIIDDGLELLTESECQRLLASNDFGRVGLSIGGLPAIIPVNYCFLDGDVVFRTGPGLKLAAAADGEVVAFEVDDHHPADRSGWSVLVVGRAEVSEDAALVARLEAARFAPSADGDRSAVVRVVPAFVSGRRLVHVSAP